MTKTAVKIIFPCRSFYYDRDYMSAIRPMTAAVSTARSFSTHVLRQATQQQVHIPFDARKRITEVFLRVVATPYDYKENFEPLTVKAAGVLQRELPAEVKRSIEEVTRTDLGFIEITGTPSDPDLMPTPEDFSGGEKKATFVSELFSMGIAGLMGQKVYNFRTEGRGTGPLILNIVPVKSQLEIKGAGGVRDGFGFHMENSWHPQSPDSLILNGLRQDHDQVAITYAISNSTIYDYLSPEEIRVLSSHTYRISPPEVHFRAEREKGIVFSADQPYLGPVIRSEATGRTFMINFNGMRSDTDDAVAETALKRIEQIAQEKSHHARLNPDNALVINNNRAIHTRNGYIPRFDGLDRWFQRYYLIEPEKMWSEAVLGISDFPMLSETSAVSLLNFLVSEGIITREGRLTPKCNPHIDRLPLPVDLEEHRLAITKAILRKGPAFPHRVV